MSVSIRSAAVEHYGKGIAEVSDTDLPDPLEPPATHGVGACVSERSTLEAWWRSLALMHIAHHRSAAHYRRMHRILGTLAVLLAAVSGSSFLLDWAGNTTAGLLALASAGVGGVNTFQDNGDRAGSHHAAAVGFMALRRRVEWILASDAPDFGGPQEMDGLLTAWESVLGSAPQLPKRIHDDQQKKTKPYCETLRGQAGT